LNVVALVLSQFVALPTPLTIPPGGPLLIRANVVEGSAAEFNGRTVIAFTSAEREAATRGTATTGGDLWLATWDGVTVSSRLLCPATTPRFREAHLAATSARVLIVSQMTNGVSAVMLDSSLRPVSVPCGTQVSTDQTTGLRVTASGDSFLITYQSSTSGAVVSRWVSPLGSFGNELSFNANVAVAARPSPLAIDAGVRLTYRASSGANLSVSLITLVGATWSFASGSAAHGTWTATDSSSGPLLVAWTRPPTWQLMVTGLDGGTLDTPRVWSSGTTALSPPAPLVLSTDAGVAIFSWLPGTAPAPQLDVYANPAPMTFVLPPNRVPVAVAPPGALVTQEGPNAFGIATVLVASGLVGVVQDFVNERPSHQRSVNVVWTPQGWLVLWEEPRTQLAGLFPRTVIRAVLTDGRAGNVSELSVQAPGRSPRLRRRPTQAGELLASFELPDGGTTIVPLSLSPPNLFVGNPVVPEIGRLGGFEVNATELVRWTPDEGTPPDVIFSARPATTIVSASSRGAFASDTFWLPKRGLAATNAWDLNTGSLLMVPSFSNREVEDEIAVGAAPHDLPSELFFAWNERDAGLAAVIQAPPPLNAGSVSITSARFLGGRPVRVGGRWLVGIRQPGGPPRLLVQPAGPLSTFVLADARGEVVEFESAEAPDGGEAAFVWTSWEDDGQDAGPTLADAGSVEPGTDAGARPEVTLVPQSCGCQSSAGALGLRAAVALWRRRARRGAVEWPAMRGGR
jgi:hypothetical protein